MASDSREETRKRAADMPIDPGKGYYNDQFMGNLSKASRETQSKRMRETADKAEADYGKKPAASSAPAKSAPKKAAAKKSARKRSAPAPVVGDKLASLRASQREKAPGGKIEMEEAKVSLPASKRPEVKQASASAAAPAKKKGKLRRAISSVGKGFRSAGRGVKRAFSDAPSKSKTTEMAKSSPRKGGYEGKWA